jgi:hypothetical protein
MEDRAAADGTVGVDAVWKRRLARALADTPLAQSVLEAVAPLVGLLEGAALDDLTAVIDDKRAEWRDELYSADGVFKLPRTYLLDFAIAIHLYTLADPAVHKVINKAMFNPTRRQPGGGAAAAPGGAGGVSAELTMCLPFIRFLDAALEALPAAYLFRGRVRRGVQWCFPSPERHDPEGYFATGKMVTWYEFKSTSTSHAVMTRDHFCGLRPGPRTIFTVDACRAYSIEKFSIFQGMDSEYEVLFRPLSQFRVVHATKNIVDPTERGSPERSGFPDAVGLIQIDEAPPPPLTQPAVPAASAAAAGPSPQMPSYEEQMAWALQQSTLDATPAPTEAEMAAFFAKVGGSLEQVRSASELNWSCRQFTDGDCKIIAHLIAKFMPAVTTLDLEDNNIGAEGAKAIAEALKVNMILTTLGLSANSIGDEGAKAIAEALKVNAVLTDLALWINGIGDEGAIAIAEALKVNAVLTKLNLNYNSMGVAGETAVRDAVKDRSGFVLHM